MRYYKCDLKGALLSLDNEFFSFHQPNFQDNTIEQEKKYTVISVSSIQNKLLILYAKQRGLDLTHLNKYCNEIYYQREQKTYYGIGFKNVLEGYEIRNKFFKGCLGNKSITTIENNCNQVILFEGWIDFLSLLVLYPSIEYCFDFIVLNSTSQRESVSNLKVRYEKVYLCFDNDLTGDKTTSFFMERYGSLVKDIRYFFKEYKDLNEYLVSKTKE